MHILNAMFGCGLGGIEQSFMDYSLGLAGAGHRVTSLVHPKAKLLPMLESHSLPIKKIANWGGWDLVAVYRLAQLISSEKPDIIIAHGGRAATLLIKAAKGKTPLVGVCHNDNIRRLLGCDALFTVTETLRQRVIRAGKPPESVHTVPNMITPSPQPSLPRTWQNPPVIGTLGRFIKPKGFDQYIEALHILTSKNIHYRAVLAGDGTEAGALRALAEKKGVGGLLSFPGWVQDKAAFFNSIDIFCLPSHSEAFGIVLLEAFNYGVPVVSTECQGPKEIITHNTNGILVPRSNAEALAAGLEQLISNKAFADTLAAQAYQNLQSHYAMPVVAEHIAGLLETILHTKP